MSKYGPCFSGENHLCFVNYFHILFLCIYPFYRMLKLASTQNIVINMIQQSKVKENYGMFLEFRKSNEMVIKSGCLVKCMLCKKKSEV